MLKVVTVEQMRAIEEATDAAGVSYAAMMQRAGGAVAEVVRRMVVELPDGGRVVVLVGPGNNGGDGLVAARILAEQTEAEVRACLLKPRDESDQVYADAVDAGVSMTVASEDGDWEMLRQLVTSADILIDALLGTGARLPVEGELKALLENASAAMGRPVEDEWLDAGLVWPAAPLEAVERGPVVVAVDCPSGLDSDTGELDPAALPADVTVTFAAAKVGQLKFPGAAAVGELVVADIGTPPDLAELQAVTVEMADGASVGRMLPRRSADSHKGTYGTVLAIAGSANYVGAVGLLGEAAYRVGAGLVTLAIPATIYPMLASSLQEATWILLPQDMGVVNVGALTVLRDEFKKRAGAVLLGPGLGQEEPTETFIRGLFQGRGQAKRGQIGFVSSAPANPAAPSHEFEIGAPLVIDADGLNNLSQIDEWWKLLPAGTILTPHPGEMARLCGTDVEEVLADRSGLVVEKAREWKATIVLKGAYTLVASAEGRLVVIPFATDALATAGTGDVLAGCITGLLAQGMAPFDAAVAGAYLHGLAGRIAGEALNSRATIASDVLAALPAALSLVERPAG